MYLKYLCYVLRHKYNVFKVCIRRGLFIHAFTHDLSKFLPSEFVPYARKFFNPNEITEGQEKEFKLAVVKHYNRNQHHLGYWLDCNAGPYTMSRKAVKQLAADWIGMSLAKSEDYIDAQVDAVQFFLENKHKMKMTDETEQLILKYLEVDKWKK